VKFTILIFSPKGPISLECLTCIFWNSREPAGTPQQSLGTVIGVTAGSREFQKIQVRHSNEIGPLGLKISMVNFTAHDWELIEEGEKKSHHKQWENDGGDGEQLDDWFDIG
jgi:hypothetical protein